jgi:hypothetical protein
VRVPSFPRGHHAYKISSGPLTPLTSMESLPTLFRRALLNLSKAFNLPTIQDETQVFIFSLTNKSIAELAVRN